MPSLDQQSMKSNSLHSPKISQRLLQKENWSVVLRPDENRTGHLPSLIPLFLSNSF